MPFGPFLLSWRAPHPNPPPLPYPLPTSIQKTHIPTPSGPLELLYTTVTTVTNSPSSNNNNLPPLLFAHGGFGSAAMWIPYMQFFASRGYACYAVSYRGHGGSWYPGFLGLVWGTTRGELAGDLGAGLKWVEEREKGGDGRRGGGGGGGGNVVLIAHSAGAALAQWMLARGVVRVRGFGMVAGVPGFGSFKVYTHWLPTALPNFLYRACHPRYLLTTLRQIHTSFFTSSTPFRTVRAFAAHLSPYESMLWPLQSLLPFVRGPDVLGSITGFRGEKENEKVRPGLLVLAAQHDVLCTPAILADAAGRYREAFKGMDGEGGVWFRVVEGVAHHLQNHEEWEGGAEVLLEWLNALAG
ncbi:alpha/beta-hydrolase [Periconia macrospinosa]|uniref:Alpha/beta-hydrolase n=1 Tax=Periconia macrospinosa TaxID=97972 RepID=A0A2V1D562_9PLEO|nr:alpha/beta-hydrolase [Periconia macrospinosa]